MDLAVSCTDATHTVAVDLVAGRCRTTLVDHDDRAAAIAYAALTSQPCACIDIADTVSEFTGVDPALLAHLVADGEEEPYVDRDSVLSTIVEHYGGHWQHAALLGDIDDLTYFAELIDAGISFDDYLGYTAYNITRPADMAANPIPGRRLVDWHGAGIDDYAAVTALIEAGVNYHHAGDYATLGIDPRHWPALAAADIRGGELRALNRYLDNLDDTVAAALAGRTANDYAYAHRLGVSVDDIDTFGGASDITLYQFAGLDLDAIRHAANVGFTGTDAVLWSQHDPDGTLAGWLAAKAAGVDIAAIWGRHFADQKRGG